MIICAGESLIDFVPADSEGTLYCPKPGGSPMNCAVAAARLGASVKFAGTVSRDFFGDRILSHLEENHVDTSMVARVQNPTTLAFVSASESGDARYAFYAHHSADRALTPDHLPDAIPAGAVLQIGSISLLADPESRTLITLAERCRSEHIVVFDPNVRPNLVDDESDYRHRVERAFAASAIVKASEEDLAWLFPERSLDQAASSIFSSGAELVVVTRGASGSEIRTPLHTVQAPGKPVQVVDTIGAGDSFMAAILVWLEEHLIASRDQLRELAPEQLALMLDSATRVGSFACTRAGADPPWRDELTDPSL